MESFYQRDGFYIPGIGFSNNLITNYLRKAKLSRYVKKLNLSPFNSVMDFGCGDGQLVEVLRQKGFDAIGVDFQLCSRHQNLAYFKTYDQIENESLGKIDVIILRHVLEHVNEPNKFLKILAEKFKCNHFLVEVPNFESHFRYFFKKNYSQLAIPGHLYHFSANSLACTLKDFDITNISNVSVVVLGKSLFKVLGFEVGDMGAVNLLFYPLQLTIEFFHKNKTALLVSLSPKTP
jgi:SAM-dependent methyltransferase